MQQEPSVLDYFKSRINYFWQRLLGRSPKQGAILPPEPSREETPVSVNADVQPGSGLKVKLPLPWLALLALSLALMAQRTFEPVQDRSWQLGTVFYLLAAGAIVWSNLRGEWMMQVWPPSDPEAGFSHKDILFHSSYAFLIALMLSLIAFLTFAGNLFNTFNLAMWFFAQLAIIITFRLPSERFRDWLGRARDLVKRPQWTIKFDRWTLLFLVACALSVFFRVYRLSEIPSQMISDHAEKLLDVSDVLSGQMSIFFPRNTGREFFQFYLTAAVTLLFKTGLTFISLKIGTVTAGIVTLFFIYLLGKEIGNRRVGLFAMFLAGIAYWPNVISRFGLRHALYPLFYAPALYFLVRGLRARNRNDFIWSGFFLGLGLHGYSPFRVVPFAILLAFVLYFLHAQSKGYRKQAAFGLFAVILVSFVVFLPLLRYMTENLDMVLYRGMTRLGSWEQPLPGPAWQIFLKNTWNSLTMFAWDDGEVWVISLPHRPALDVVMAALFHLGVVLMVVRYIRQRHWLDLYTLLSFPILMLPSILSLAFPGENPSLNRSAAAIIPVFLIVGLALDGFMAALEKISTSVWSKRLAWVMAFFLLYWSAWQNYDLVFNQYDDLFNQSAWNTSELGQVTHDFIQLTGSEDTAYLVGYPYWVDSRLVMINAGYPTRDNAIWPEGFAATLSDPRPKMFLINTSDTASANALEQLYPQGMFSRYISAMGMDGKDFLIFFVPPQ